MAEYLHEEALPGAQDTELLRRSGHRAVLPLVMAVRANNSLSPALRWQMHRHVLGPELTAGPISSGSRAALAVAWFSQVYLEAGRTQQAACPSLLPLSITSHPQTLSEGQVKHKASQEPLSQTL